MQLLKRQNCRDNVSVGQLLIENAKKHDAGTYLCTASNGIGRQQTKVISVEVQGERLSTSWNFMHCK